MSAFAAAYQAAQDAGVLRLVADSALGELLRDAQDPFGLARRLRLRD